MHEWRLIMRSGRVLVHGKTSWVDMKLWRCQKCGYEPHEPKKYDDYILRCPPDDHPVWIFEGSTYKEYSCDEYACMIALQE